MQKWVWMGYVKTKEKNIGNVKTKENKRVRNFKVKTEIEENIYFTFSDLENSISCGKINSNNNFFDV